MTKENAEVVRDIFAVWETGDFSSADWADPEIEFAGVQGLDRIASHGIEEMGRAWGEFLRAWKEYRVEAKEIIDAGDRVVVLLVFHGEGRASGVPIDEMPGAAVLTLRNGKVTRFVGHSTAAAALAEAGIGDGPKTQP